MKRGCFNNAILSVTRSGMAARGNSICYTVGGQGRHEALLSVTHALAVGDGGTRQFYLLHMRLRSGGKGGTGQVQQMAEPPLYHDIRLGL